MLRITPVSAGRAGVDYLLRASGCAEKHRETEREHDQEAAADGSPEAGSGAERDSAAAQYYLSGTDHGEPVGRWIGSGLAGLGLTEGNVSEDSVRSVFGELKHPETGEQLGRKPYQYRSYDERLEAALAAEPNTTPERAREIEREVKTSGQTGRGYYDFTFSPVKSVSVYHAALLHVGDDEAAGKVTAAHNAAVEAAMRHMDEHAAYTRTGYHGRTANGRSVGEYTRGQGLAMASFRHSTSRNGDPQLHTHVAVLNRVRCDDGKWRAVDGQGFGPHKAAADAIYTAALEQQIGRDLGVEFADRADGKGREILGVDRELCEDSSGRAAAMSAKLGELVDDYVERNGREPAPRAKRQMRHYAWAQTRPDKSTETPEAQRETWSRGNEQTLDSIPERVQQAAEQARGQGHPDRGHLPDPADREAVIRAAVGDVQRQYATWDVGNLTLAVHQQLTTRGIGEADVTELLTGLVGEATAAGNDYGVLLVTAPDVVDAPDALRRPEDGRSIFRPHEDGRYCTAEHLDVEQRIAAEARQVTAPQVSPERAAELREQLAAAGLDAEQARAALGVLTSGRAGDVLIGPAGTGKSRTVGTVSDMWTAEHGGQVLGLATSQIAAEVLQGDGLAAVNTSQFLAEVDPAEGQPTRAIQPGELYVLDEGGMSSTHELDRITALVHGAGAKLLFTGDHEQLDAVGAGGMLRKLADDNGAYTLDEVHRFSADWERAASTRIREGDVNALGEYEDRGRLREGTAEDMAAEASRGYLADRLAGRDSLLVARSNREATDVAGSIRAELVRLGHVDVEVLADLRDGNVISAGDQIQARCNDRSMLTSGGGMVTNRETFTVRRLLDDRSGRIEVERADDSTTWLTPDYVNRHVTLGYASTVHAAQGRTVDTCHSLADAGISRSGLYVAMTRGRDGNYAYVTSQHSPDEHDLSELDSTAIGVLTDVVGQDRQERAAADQVRDELTSVESLAAVGTIWDKVSADNARDRHADALLGVLGAEHMDRIEAEDGAGRLYRTLRELELGGHDVEELATSATLDREVSSADSISDVLRWRIRRETGDEGDVRHVEAPASWAERTGHTPGPLGEFESELADWIDSRTRSLGELAAAEAPEWAVEHLGDVPDDEGDRANWIRRAGTAAAYREQFSVPEHDTSIGAAPSRETPVARLMWAEAHTALGMPDSARDYYTADVAELREMRAAWEREQTWQPAHVADRLQRTSEVADEFRREATLRAAEAGAAVERGTDASEHQEQADRAERFTERFAVERGELEQLHEVRSRWVEHTAKTREQAERASAELERRGVGLVETSQPGAEQHVDEPEQSHVERVDLSEADVEVADEQQAERDEAAAVEDDHGAEHADPERQLDEAAEVVAPESEPDDLEAERDADADPVDDDQHEREAEQQSSWRERIADRFRTFRGEQQPDADEQVDQAREGERETDEAPKFGREQLDEAVDEPDRAAELAEQRARADRAAQVMAEREAAEQVRREREQAREQDEQDEAERQRREAARTAEQQAEPEPVAEVRSPEPEPAEPEITL